MSALNADPEVMRYFPGIQNEAKTLEFIQRMMKHQKEHGFCYFAAELLETAGFIGFIRMQRISWELEPKELIDIGWRLKNQLKAKV